MKWYIQVLKKYAQFSGRARRKEYWMFTLFNILFAMAAMLLDHLFGTTMDGYEYGLSEYCRRGDYGCAHMYWHMHNTGLFYVLYGLAVLIPSLAVSVRRLHDTGRSGWWLLIGLIPIIGAIWLFVLFVLDSKTGTNQYGANPKEEAPAAPTVVPPTT